jgi:hypothetical protein
VAPQQQKFPRGELVGWSQRQLQPAAVNNGANYSKITDRLLVQWKVPFSVTVHVVFIFLCSNAINILVIMLLLYDYS